MGYHLNLIKRKGKEKSKKIDDPAADTAVSAVGGQPTAGAAKAAEAAEIVESAADYGIITYNDIPYNIPYNDIPVDDMLVDNIPVEPIIDGQASATKNRTTKRKRLVKAVTKSRERCISLIIVPRYSDNKKVREYKISAPRVKLAMLLLLVLAVSAVTGFYVRDLSMENTSLYEKLASLESYAVDQHKLIEYRADDIQRLKIIEDSVNAKIEEFNNKYLEMAETYIRNRSEVAFASRSSDRTDKNFVAGIQEMRQVLTTLTDIKKTDANLGESLGDVESKIRTYLNSMPTLKPYNGAVGSGFGYRKDPITGLRRFHEGVDISAPYGGTIVAAAAGTVIRTGWNGGYGIMCEISHGRGISTIYSHCSKVLVKTGQYIKKGQAVAKVGNTGRSTAPHLHFEIKINGVQVNPLKFLYS